MVTLHDIAKATGLAPSTVSTVLNDYKGVSEETRSKVKKAVHELNYSPNLIARSLITKKSYMVGVLMDDIVGINIVHPHFSSILDSFKNEMEKSGYDLLLLNQKVGKNNISYLDHCNYRGLDGVMIAMGRREDGSIREDVKELVSSKIPCVSIDDSYDNIPLIISDGYDGAIKLLDYLYYLGHKNIALVNFNGFHIASQQRTKAYLDFTKDNKLVVNPKHLISVNGFTLECGRKAADEFLKNGVSNLPSAIMCIYDELAIGLKLRFEELGIRVPERVSVVGFDDIEVAHFFKLTTVRQNREQIGIKAANILISKIEHSKDNEMMYKDNNEILIPTELIVRDSSQVIR